MSTQELLLLETTLGSRYDFGRAEYGKDHINVNEANRGLLRRWLILKGIPETKALTSTDRVLGNAYRGGDNYIAKMLEGDNGDRFAPRKRRGTPMDLNIKSPPGFGSPQVLDLLGGTPEPDPNIQQGPGQGPGQGGSPSPSPSPIDPLAIATVVDQVITPRLETARQDLRRQANQALRTLTEANARDRADLRAGIETQVGGALDAALAAASLTDRLKTEISLLATQAAVDFVERMVPRRIEVGLANGQVRELKAEPRHRAFNRILRHLLRGQHVYGVGPAGTGKTHLAKQLAEALDFDLDTEFFPIDQALTKFDVKGYKGPTGEYIETLVRRAVEFGGLLFIDEADMWAAAALGCLNSILANDYGAFPDGTVKVHPRFRCFVTANTYGHGATVQYQGRNPLDAASLDRFTYVMIDYDPDLERQIYGNHPWVDYVQAVRRAIDDLKTVKHIVSMRATARGLTDLAGGDDPADVCFAQLWRSLEPDTIARIKSQVGEFGQRHLRIA